MIPQPVPLHETIALDPTDANRLRIYPAPVLKQAPVRPDPFWDEEQSNRLLDYLKYRWVTILFLGALLGSLCGWIAWKVVPAKYTTYSLIHISAETPTVYFNENAQGRNDFPTYLKTQADMLRSYFVLSAALRDPKVSSLPMLRQEIDPIRFLEDELKVDFKDGSSIIKISLSGEDAEGIALILNAIQKAYFVEVIEEERRRRNARLLQLEDSIQTNRKELEKQWERIKKSPPKKNDVPTTKTPEYAASQIIRLKENLMRIESEIQVSKTKRDDLKSRLEAPEQEVVASPTVLDQLDKDPKIQTLNKSIAEQQKRLTYYKRDLLADPNHQAVLEVERKLKNLTMDRDQLRKMKWEEYCRTRQQTISQKLQQDLAELQSHLITLNTNKQQASQFLQEMEELAAKSTTQAGEPIDFPVVEMKDRETLLKGMIDKANLLRVEVNGPSRVRPVQSAAVPIKKEYKKQILATLAAVVLGFGLVAGWVGWYESRVQRVLQLQDLEQAGIGPILGVIPSTNPVFVDPSHQAMLLAESIEKIRLVISESMNKPGQVVLITSAMLEEGKSTLCYRLAASYQRSGASVVILDFDLRQPSIHEEVDLPNDAGLCEVLLGTLNWQESIVHTANDVFVIPAGRWSDAVRAHLLGERLVTLFSRLRETFDVIVINTHPILKVAQTHLLTRFADTILLTVENYESRLPFVLRAKEKLAPSAVETFGIIFQGATEKECLH